ncbi:MAG: HWE histidine kinase domain-containing protein [Methylocystis sp.]|uniref:HWE histidine kinase domain-containing protein n=1 Tax=Methylocystis sp. TaxID=1911079 RepID=UPI00391FDFDA
MPQPVDLTNCDDEQIQFPGSIQQHGLLLACDGAGRVQRYSANIREEPDLRSIDVGIMLGDALTPKIAHDLFNALAITSDPSRPALLRGLTIGAATYDVACHSHAGYSIFEFERGEPGSTANDPLEITRALIAKTAKLTSLAALNRPLPNYLRAMFGYDRVMIYEFAEDGSGEVVGEAKNHVLESFLGQHFPASDIPNQARELYLKNTIRVISDANGPSNPIIPEFDAAGAPLDLSFAHLRSVSPIHLEYLRNMGVGASMSVSIIVDGRLWGLIACHHYAPKTLTMSQRTAAELFGDFLSLHITSIYQRMRATSSLNARAALDRVLKSFSFHHTAEGFLRESLADFGNVIPSDGVGLWMNGVWTSDGFAPPMKAAGLLADVSAQNGGGGVWRTNNISDHVASASAYAADAAGMLAIPLSLTKRDYLFFFRREKVQTLNWAGDPNKTYAAGPHGDRLTPRKSFAIWKQTIERQSEPWTEDEYAAAEAVLFGIRELILKQNEILDAERKKAEVRMRILNDELNHRVKNILALIKSLVNQPSAGHSLEEFVVGLQGRILALANAHDQVVRSDGGGSLRQLLLAELSPYPADQIQLDGPDIGLEARAYSVMALAIHELATNAAKYGALSDSNGTLSISWRQSDDGDLEIEWRERGGPHVTPPTRSGFGSVLLARSIPFDLQGKSEVTYASAGVEAFFSLPLQFIAQLRRARDVSPASEAAPQAASHSFDGWNFLLVEDQLVIALEAEDMLRELGARNISTVATENGALEILHRSRPDCAIVDVNLGSTTSVSVADELARLGIPFIFATGYGDSVMIPHRLRSVPVVRKPYTGETMAAGLARAIEMLQRRGTPSATP